MRQNLFDSIPPETVSGDDNVFAKFLQNEGLYSSMEINKDNINDLILLLDGKVRISSYCKECKSERVFTMEPYIHFEETDNDWFTMKLSEEVLRIQRQRVLERTPQPGGYIIDANPEWKWKNWQIDETTRVLVFKFVCSMNEEHHLDYVVLTDDKSFRKIGQFPSVADLSFPELDEYKKVMSKEDRKEFGRANGLYASGIGAGSYVYLRRILERLLMQAKASAGDEIDQKIFNEARVGEKITMLKNYLPATLTDNKVMYGILSKGIHELTEEECLEYFPVLREGLYMILSQWEEMRKKKEQEKTLSDALSRIASKVK